MEKVVCALWGTDNARLRSELPAALAAAGASRIRINLQDDTVAPGAALRQVNMHPQMEAVAQFWVPSAYAPFMAGLHQALTRASERHAAWLVAESTIIPNSLYAATPGQRTEGFSQLAFLGLPPRLTHDEWRTIWQVSHTRVAIETQSNFEYVQNLVVRALTDDAPPLAGFVEECFPIGALTDPSVFFDAVGDQAKFDANLAAMMESCARFIDFDRIDVLITSQFDFA
jgi:EthD domain